MDKIEPLQVFLFVDNASHNCKLRLKNFYFSFGCNGKRYLGWQNNNFHLANMYRSKRKRNIGVFYIYEPGDEVKSPVLHKFSEYCNRRKTRLFYATNKQQKSQNLYDFMTELKIELKLRM